MTRPTKKSGKTTAPRVEAGFGSLTGALYGSMLIRLVVFASLFALACSKQTPQPEPEQPVTATEPVTKPVVKKRSAKDVTFDGLELGDTYKPVMAKPPYDKPCDDDPVNKTKTMRAMVYGGKPCRGNTFSDGTTLILYIPNVEGDEFDVPIRAVIWLGGTYFDSRSNLGVKVGARRKEVHALFGPPIATFNISERKPLAAEAYDGDFFAIFDGDSAAGFGLGPLPKKLSEGEYHWEVVDEMYRKYTARVTSLSQAATREACEKLFDKYIELMKADPDEKERAKELEGERTEAIGHCVGKISAAELACADKATTFAEIRECETRGR